MSRICITKVVTRDIVSDFIADVKNAFGRNLTEYEKMMQKAIKEIDKELDGKKLAWYRYEITQLGNGAVIVMLYGETND